MSGGPTVTDPERYGVIFESERPCACSSTATGPATARAGAATRTRLVAASCGLRPIACVALAVLVAAASAVAPADASADRRCGAVPRQFTDGVAEVVVRRGALRCATARGLLRRYWGTRVDAFSRTLSVRFAGIRWRCGPTVSDFPLRWACEGGGPGRDRFRVTARE
jgi:hypothetical protein